MADTDHPPPPPPHVRYPENKQTTIFWPKYALEWTILSPGEHAPGPPEDPKEAGSANYNVVLVKSLVCALVSQILDTLLDIKYIHKPII